jgi:hypothetical protein
MKLTFAPGYTDADYPEGVTALSLEQQIDAFEKMYKIWILSFAEKLVDIPDSGFATLMILNAYPEMIAQLHGFRGDKQELFEKGVCLIIPKLTEHKKVKDICLHLYSYMRSGLAHMSFTSKNIVLTEDFPYALDIRISEDGAEIGIFVNPRMWFEYIRQHFQNYIDSLKNPSNVDLRMKFSNRLTKPF